MPALWLHNVVALTPCVSVNLFFKHLGSSAYANKDLYGNKVGLTLQRCDEFKDLPNAAKARQHVQSAAALLSDLPQPYRTFYSRRLAETIRDLAETQADRRPADRSRDDEPG